MCRRAGPSGSPCRADPRQGLRHLIGAVSDSDTSALHRALGFRDAGVYSQDGWKFGRLLDVTVMQLDLDPDGGRPMSPGLDLGGGKA